MTTAYEIPTTPVLPQQFSIELAGIFYILTLHWCDPALSWVLDIADILGNALIQGIPLVTGVDLLAQYEYVGIGGSLIVQSDNDPDLVPDYKTLGTTGHLFFITEP